MKQLAFRLTPDEKKKIEKVATEKSLPVATFCRFIVLDQIKKMENQA